MKKFNFSRKGTMLLLTIIAFGNFTYKNHVERTVKDDNSSWLNDVLNEDGGAFLSLILSPASVKPSLPITFQDTVAINHELATFGGNNSWMVIDPTDPNNIALQSIKTAGAQGWAGTTIGNSGLGMAIPFS
ncbi:MAG: hypothetical protein ACPG19_12100, partial [Saprospiraceae bacterium]